MNLDSKPKYQFILIMSSFFAMEVVINQSRTTCAARAFFHTEAAEYKYAGVDVAFFRDP